MSAAALRRRYGRARAKASAWRRVEGGYELTTGAVTYRIQHRKDLTDRQKWDLDQRLGLKPRDGKRREEWVVMVDRVGPVGYETLGWQAFDHAYSKPEAIGIATKRIDEAR